VKRIHFGLLALAMSLTMGAFPTLGHHGNAAYDMEKVVPLKATITGFEFGNPHVQIFFDTKDEDGKVLHWNCEGTNPAMLSRIGWTRTTLKPGDQVTLYIHPNKNPEITVGLMVKVVLANGQVLDSKNPV
jgi:hypothetical protein